MPTTNVGTKIHEDNGSPDGGQNDAHRLTYLRDPCELLLEFATWVTINARGFPRAPEKSSAFSHLRSIPFHLRTLKILRVPKSPF